MQKEHLYELISLKLSGEAGPDDLKALNEYLAEHPQEQAYVAQLETIWKETRLQVRFNSKTAFDKHIKTLNPGKEVSKIVPDQKISYLKMLTLKRVVAVAASIILVALSLFYLVPKKADYIGSQLTSVSTKYGAKKKLQLPDGSQVWLNSGSSISYNKKFSKTHREIELVGEAFFDVVKDKEHPFLIHTKLMDIKVLGTAFNVRSYPNEKTSEAALVRGLVQIIMRENPGETLFLRPNEKIIINGTPNKGFKNSNKITTEPPRIVLTQMHRLKEENSSIETSWVENKLAFDNETLEQIALKLERWFDVKVTVHDTLKESTFYGVFEDEKLDEVLTALQITGNFHFKINGSKEVVIIP